MFDPYNTKQNPQNYAEIEQARALAIQNYLPLPNTNTDTDNTDRQFGGSGIRDSTFWPNNK